MTTTGTCPTHTCPDGQAEAVSDDGWVLVGAASELFVDRKCASAMVTGTRVGLFEVEGGFYAIDDICSHGNARLSRGEVDGWEVECPLHAGVFDIRTGKALTAPLTRDVRAHEVKEENGRLFVRINR